jgi:hypothetical protein
MPQDTIKCPKCGTEIRISQILSQDIETEVQQRYEKKMEDWKKDELDRARTQSAKEASELLSKQIEKYKKDIEDRDKQINENNARENEFAKREEELKIRETKVTEELEKGRRLIEDQATKKAQESIRVKVADLEMSVKEKEERLQKAEQNELELRKAKRELEEDKKTFELKMERTLDQERQKITEKAKSEVEEGHKLKDMEKDKQLEDMKKQIEELKRKAEQGSQKIQGEVLELELEKILRDEFQFDEIEPVSAGVRGGDIIHTVKTQSGRICGKILWESKRTRNWSDTWIQKVKDDQREAKADLATIVSEALPKGFHHFRQIEGVWVTDLPSVLSLAVALRFMLIQIATTRELQTGKEEKMEIVYNYLTGSEFRNRVQAIVEAFISLRRDLDSEKRAMESIWAKREKQIERVVLNISGMHGDLEGIVGATLPSVKLLELPEGD